MSKRNLLTTFVAGLSLTVVGFAQTATKPGQTGNKPEAPKAAAPATGKTAPSPGMVVAVDPATGEFRQPTAAEMAILGAAQERAAASNPTIRTQTLPNGAVLADVPDSLASYTVVSIGPDGKLKMDCVQGPDAAKKMMDAPASHKGGLILNKKEAANDR